MTYGWYSHDHVRNRIPKDCEHGSHLWERRVVQGNAGQGGMAYEIERSDTCFDCGKSAKVAKAEVFAQWA